MWQRDVNLTSSGQTARDSRKGILTKQPNIRINNIHTFSQSDVPVMLLCPCLRGTPDHELLTSLHLTQKHNHPLADTMEGLLMKLCAERKPSGCSCMWLMQVWLHLLLVSCFFRFDLFPRSSSNLDPDPRHLHTSLSTISYPKHAGEANPGPGPPCQSRGQRQRHGGHPAGKNKSATQGRNPRYSQKFLLVPRRLQRHRSMPEGVEGNAALVFSLWWP